MKNIIDILKDFGVEIPEDKVAELNKEVNENYKTVAEFNKKINTLTTERDNYKTQFDTANETLKGFEGVDVEGMKTKLSEYESKVKDLEADYTTKLNERDFRDALTEAMKGYKFTSKSAQETVMNKIKAMQLPLKNGVILGLSDAVASIKAEDESVFVNEDAESTPPAKFTTSVNKSGGKSYKNKDEIMAIKDAKERQEAIAQHLDWFGVK